MNSATTPLEPTRFTSYRFEKLLPGATLVLDSESSCLLLQRSGEIVELQQFSPSEFFVAEALLENYPEYCPYAYVLHAMTGKSLKYCQERVNWGEDNNETDSVMRPVRNLLGRTRYKLRFFGIEVKSLVHMGYMLVPDKAGIRRQNEPFETQP